MDTERGFIIDKKKNPLEPRVLYLQVVLLKEKNIDTGFWSSLLGFFKARAGDFPHDQLL